MTCHACGAQLSSTARFCHKCGATVASVGATGWRAGLPWALAGAVLGALIAVVAMRASAPSPARSDEPAAPFASSGGARPPDISQMSPEERANRLFNRVMILAEAGKTDSVQFFLPMALGAYSQLPGLDVDARYHVGLLQLAGGDAKAALAQADTIRQTIPTHLFIYLLRAHAYNQLGIAQEERRAYVDFLHNESAELAQKRPEYGQDAHLEALTNFHAEAERKTRTGGRTS
jgi:zinc ribbon protein